MRVQVSIGPKTVKRIDKYAKEIGVTRSALCSMLIFNGLPAEETEDEFVEYMNEKVTEREIEKTKF